MSDAAQNFEHRSLRIAWLSGLRRETVNDLIPELRRALNSTELVGG